MSHVFGLPLNDCKRKSVKMRRPHALRNVINNDGRRTNNQNLLLSDGFAAVTKSILMNRPQISRSPNFTSSYLLAAADGVERGIFNEAIDYAFDREIMLKRAIPLGKSVLLSALWSYLSKTKTTVLLIGGNILKKKGKCSQIPTCRRKYQPKQKKRMTFRWNK